MNSELAVNVGMDVSDDSTEIFENACDFLGETTEANDEEIEDAVIAAMARRLEENDE